MAIADYAEIGEGESPEKHLRRLIVAYLYANGGNHPDDVARWLRENTGEVLAMGFMEGWGQLANDEHDFVDVTDDDDEADIETFEVIEGEAAEGDVIDQKGVLRAIKRVARKDSRRNQRRAARAAGKRLLKRADKRRHSEKYNYTLADVTAIFEEIKANGG